jgi:predicted aldo/keto reductase-like oxidoreductase
VIAMSVLASGAIPPREAIEWVANEPYVASILFGASSRQNIDSTVRIIRELDAAKAAA